LILQLSSYRIIISLVVLASQCRPQDEVGLGLSKLIALISRKMKESAKNAQLRSARISPVGGKKIQARFVSLLVESTQRLTSL
jgi:hypothetical protein